MAEHEARAARRMPGPDFHEVLGWIHGALRPAVYVEIGVHSGASLAVVRPGTRVIGIDPQPQMDAAAFPALRLFAQTSSEFFRRGDLAEILGANGIGFALIDGLHRFEQALEDFCNLERHMAPGGMVAVHDTIPLDEETSARERSTEFYTGDVWKLVPLLGQHRPELEMVTVTAPPTGLTLIRGLRRGCDAAPVRAVTADYLRLRFDDFERGRGRFLATIPNQRAAVEAFCQ
jgi:predicted O-methyltransferase YrrM